MNDRIKVNQGFDFDRKEKSISTNTLKNSSNKKGFLYKTHTIRNKFSNPQIIYKKPSNEEDDDEIGDLERNAMRSSIDAFSIDKNSSQNK